MRWVKLILGSVFVAVALVTGFVVVAVVASCIALVLALRRGRPGAAHAGAGARARTAADAIEISAIELPVDDEATPRATPRLD